MIILTGNGVADDNQDAKLAELADRLAQPKAKLLLHLHGLVSEVVGTAMARRLAGTGDTSWNLGGDWIQHHVWRTDILDIMQRNRTDLVQDDRLYRTVLRKLMCIVARKTGIPAPGGPRPIESTSSSLRRTMRSE
ncbi:hypothetical protein CN200_32040 [Sinorhizobium meliloti]|uniref:hypothetical protein n=1 Tax=Rhizobium meliloti TaxID=382 RepID=UPI000FD3219D|nr:hypothetical protein [Sinorhizobium meliloti]MDX0531541.1 hypothetical protein [Sinorhizobium medicae]MDX0931491.1 hypothetical protein [Sinorhizobium medicae]RVI05090.1 hypothetical protein CN200_32040 [Sinorhizobium meliloti]RVN84772.1 hypothetical protein CN107_20835 [Sinorhizobium meliloti]RVO11719.1 hypothetical protein CN103_12860 [Sinorhizobium meliloti]